MIHTLPIRFGCQSRANMRSTSNRVISQPRRFPALVEDYLREVIQEQANYADYYDYVAKRGAGFIKELIAKYKEIAPFTEEPDTYYDFGDDEKFSLIKYGKAECSAGLFDHIKIDQDTIRENLER